MTGHDELEENVRLLRQRSHDQNAAFSRMEGTLVGIAEQLVEFTAIRKTVYMMLGALVLLSVLFPITIAVIVSVLKH